MLFFLLQAIAPSDHEQAGNALVAHINAQRLPQGNTFHKNNPAPGIASVVITQTGPKSIQMVVTGTTSAPSSQITQTNARGITLSISRAPGTAVLGSTSCTHHFTSITDSA